MNDLKEQLQKEIWDFLTFDERNNTGIHGGNNPIYLDIDEGWCLRWIEKNVKEYVGIDIRGFGISVHDDMHVYPHYQSAREGNDLLTTLLKLVLVIHKKESK